MAPARTASDPLTKRLPRPVPLGPPLAEADEERGRDGGDDEEDKADGDADFFAELLTARRGGRGLGVRRVGAGGGKQGEGGAGEELGVVAFLVDDEGEGEVGG